LIKRLFHRIPCSLQYYDLNIFTTVHDLYANLGSHYINSSMVQHCTIFFITERIGEELNWTYLLQLYDGLQMMLLSQHWDSQLMFPHPKKKRLTAHILQLLCGPFTRAILKLVFYSFLKVHCATFFS